MIERKRQPLCKEYSPAKPFDQQRLAAIIWAYDKLVKIKVRILNSFFWCYNKVQVKQIIFILWLQQIVKTKLSKHQSTVFETGMRISAVMAGRPRCVESEISEFGLNGSKYCNRLDVVSTEVFPVVCHTFASSFRNCFSRYLLRVHQPHQSIQTFHEIFAMCRVRLQWV